MSISIRKIYNEMQLNANSKYIDEILSHKKKWTRQEAYDRMMDAVNKHGISKEEFVTERFYVLSPEQLEEYFNNAQDRARVDYLAWLNDAPKGRVYWKALKIHDEYKIPLFYFAEHNLYAVKLRRISKFEAAREDFYSQRRKLTREMAGITGWPIKDVRRFLREIRDKYHVSTRYVRDHELFKYSWEEIDELIRKDQEEEEIRTERIKKDMNWSDYELEYSRTLCKLRYGIYSIVTYDNLQCWKYTVDQLDTFAVPADTEEMGRLYNVVSTEILSNKPKFDENYKKFLGRKYWLNRDTTLEEFKEFTEGLTDVFCKPINLLGGHGSYRYTLTGDTEADYEYFMNEPEILVEEVIKQHHLLNEIYDNSVNSVRVTAVIKDGEFIPFLSWIKFGARGSVMDGRVGGGCFAGVDVKTGKVETLAIDKDNNRFDKHPDTGKPITGFQIPYWDEVLQLAEDALRHIGGIDYAGWDIGITENGPVIIEGNAKPSFSDIQLVYNYGSTEPLGQRWRYEFLLDDPNKGREISEDQRIKTLRTLQPQLLDRRTNMKIRSLPGRVYRKIRKMVDPEGYNIDFSKRQVEKRDQRKKKMRKRDGYDFMMQETELTRKELANKLKTQRRMGITPITFAKFKGYGLYKMSDEQAARTLNLMKKETELIHDLMWDIRLVDLGKLTYEEMEPKIEEYKTLNKKLLTRDYKNEIAAKAAYLYPETLSEDEIDELVADMEFTRNVLRYNYNAYVTFHFKEKTIAERREFISPKERMMLLPTINTEASKAILDDKVLTYERLSDYYGRDMVRISRVKDFDKFKEFFEKNKKAVVKPRFDSLGKGIELVNIDDVEDIKELFDTLLARHKHFLLEGFITAADEIKALNPDSVNTVRMIAYYDGEKTDIRSVSMRIGHVGSFVDNAGAGGITVNVDKETGVICSNGCDEKGFTYEKHPDLGYVLKGYQLPAWDKALKIINEVSGKIEGATYVGWDIACTSDYEWVLVEGNAKTGFFGAQAPLNWGRRRDFLNTIGADPKGVLCDERPLKDAEYIKDKYGIPVQKTMEHLRHCEELGLDGRYYKDNNVWKLSDGEVIALRDRLAAEQKRECEKEQAIVKEAASKSGLDAAVVESKLKLAKLFGYNEDWFVEDEIYLLSDDEIKDQKNFREEAVQ